LLMPRFTALDILHSDADPEGRSYLDLATGQATLGQAGVGQTAQPQFSVRDIDAAIGAMSSAGTGITSFTSPQVGNNSKGYLLKIMQSYKPDQWEVVHQVNRPDFVQRASEQDWNAILDIIRTMSSQAPQGSAGGNQ